MTLRLKIAIKEADSDIEALRPTGAPAAPTSHEKTAPDEVVTKPTTSTTSSITLKPARLKSNTKQQIPQSSSTKCSKDKPNSRQQKSNTKPAIDLKQSKQSSAQSKSGRLKVSSSDKTMSPALKHTPKSQQLTLLKSPKSAELPSKKLPMKRLILTPPVAMEKPSHSTSSLHNLLSIQPPNLQEQSSPSTSKRAKVTGKSTKCAKQSAAISSPSKRKVSAAKSMRGRGGKTKQHLTEHSDKPANASSTFASSSLKEGDSPSKDQSFTVTDMSKSHSTSKLESGSQPVTSSKRGRGRRSVSSRNIRSAATETQMTASDNAVPSIDNSVPGPVSGSVDDLSSPVAQVIILPPAGNDTNPASCV